MLVRVDDDGVLAIGQLSHSWLAGQLARAWGNERFGGVEPREEIVLGVTGHDVGWATRDLRPQLNPETGRPRSFLELTVEEYLSVWRGAPDLLLSQSTWASLIVSLHGASLSMLRARVAPDQAPHLQPHIDEERARQQRLCAALEVSREQLQRLRRQVWTWDSLSLALCLRWQPYSASDVPTADGLTAVELCDHDDATCTLEPWPFADERVELRCEGRRLAPRYEKEAELREDFERAAPLTLAFALTRARQREG